MMMWTMARTPRDSNVLVPCEPMILDVLKAPKWMDIEKKRGSREGPWDVTDAQADPLNHHGKFSRGRRGGQSSVHTTKSQYYLKLL